MSNKISLILSGGGVRATSYLGFIKAIEEKGIEIDLIGGISGGALAAVTYARGKDFSFIKDLYEEDLSLWKLFERRFITKRVVMSEKMIDKQVDKLVGNLTFDELKVKVIIYATNLTDNSLDVFSEGKIFNPLRATIALAPIIPMVEFNEKKYLDGGFLALFPTKITRKYTKSPIVGLMTRRLKDNVNIPVAKRFNYFNIMLKNYYNLMFENDKPDMYFPTIEKDMEHMFSFKSMEEFYEEGYRLGKKSANKILKNLESK